MSDQPFHSRMFREVQTTVLIALGSFFLGGLSSHVLDSISQITSTRTAHAAIQQQLHVISVEVSRLTDLVNDLRVEQSKNQR